jgi:aspartate/methionine/tyrosine aminotransferase
LRGQADAGPFVQQLVDTHGVAVAPGHFFDRPAHFRISLAGRTEVLEQGLARIGEALGVGPEA